MASDACARASARNSATTLGRPPGLPLSPFLNGRPRILFLAVLSHITTISFGAEAFALAYFPRRPIYHCTGLCPRGRSGLRSWGTAAAFEEARTDFETAWRVLLAKRTTADFQAWRD